VLSSLAYPNLLETKMLGSCCCCNICNPLYFLMNYFVLESKTCKYYHFTSRLVVNIICNLSKLELLNFVVDWNEQLHCKNFMSKMNYALPKISGNCSFCCQCTELFWSFNFYVRFHPHIRAACQAPSYVTVVVQTIHGNVIISDNF
jgi:hypothetical protein